MTDLERLADIVERGSIKEVRSCVRKLLDSGVSPEEVVSHGFMPGLAIVGQKFDEGEYFITNMLLSARAVKMGYEVIRPELGETVLVSHKKVVLGTVQGDLHNIGKNLVAMAIRLLPKEVIADHLGVTVVPPSTEIALSAGVALLPILVVTEGFDLMVGFSSFARIILKTCFKDLPAVPNSLELTPLPRV